MAVIWLTGLPKAGKSTIGRYICRDPRLLNEAIVRLDGDELRAILPRPMGFDVDSRRDLAAYYANLARLLSEQGLLVVCATVSLFWEVHRWSRANIKGYYEVLLDVDEATRIGRDSTGAYAEDLVVGRDVAAELPEHADLVIANGPGSEPSAVAGEIVTAYLGGGRAAWR